MKPLYEALIEWVPTLRDDVMRMTSPIETEAVPSAVVPSKNVIVPTLGASTASLVDVTFAEMTSVCPNWIAGLNGLMNVAVGVTAKSCAALKWLDDKSAASVAGPNLAGVCGVFHLWKSPAEVGRTLSARWGLPTAAPIGHPGRAIRESREKRNSGGVDQIQLGGVSITPNLSHNWRFLHVFLRTHFVVPSWSCNQGVNSCQPRQLARAILLTN